MIRWTFLVALFLATPALPAAWVLDPARSEIAFTYTENGEDWPGRFPVFEGRAFYDPAFVEDTEVSLTLSTADVEMADFLRTAYSKTEPWFDTAAHPQAGFILESLTETAPGRFEAQGRTTIKGQDYPITLPFALGREGACLVAEGEVPLRLADFGMGADFVSRAIRVGEEIVLRFRLIGYRADLGPGC
ncbi:MAG: YceI family protein [Rubricella sp.]